MNNKNNVVFEFSSKETLDKAKKQIQKLIEEGRAQRVVLTNRDGETILNLSLATAIAGATAGVAAAPVLTVISGIVAFCTECTLTVVREEEKKAA